MGTGKSTWVIMSIKGNPKNRYIVVVPTLDEIKRYENGLKDINGLVSLHETDNKRSKKERFDSALEHSSVILITHALFENYLNEESFELIEQGGWRLIMDEVVTAFEQAKATHIDISGLCNVGVLKAENVKEGIQRFVPEPEKLHFYKNAGNDSVSGRQKELLKQSEIRDLYGVTTKDSHKQYYTFSLQERRLTVFKEITILTYPFLDTDLHYWFQVKGIEFKHLELLKLKETGKLSDFVLQEHSGNYTGKKFKNYIEFLDVPPKRGKNIYGLQPNHFSATSMDTVFNSKTKKKEHLVAQNDIRNDLRNLFRNQRGNMVEPDDFMFACKKESMVTFRDSQRSLTKKFIGDDTFVPFNERATNKYSDKHHLAYLYNVFAFPPVKHTVKVFGLYYDEDRYALYVLIQWIWRSAIRKGEKIKLYLPSIRMRRILEDWLNT